MSNFCTLLSNFTQLLSTFYLSYPNSRHLRTFCRDCHIFLSIFMIYALCRFSPFFVDFHDLRTFNHFFIDFHDLRTFVDFHHFLLIFTSFCRFSRFTHFCRFSSFFVNFHDLRTFHHFLSISMFSKQKRCSHRMLGQTAEGALFEKMIIQPL